MKKFFNSVIDLFLYKEPKKEEMGFELLEDKTEGIERQDDNTSDNRSDSQKENLEKQRTASGIAPLKTRKINEKRKPQQSSQSKENNEAVSQSLQINIEVMRQKFSTYKNQGIVIREFNIGRKVKAAILYIAGMVDKNTLNLSIFPQLMSKEAFDGRNEECTADYLMENVIAVYSVNKTSEYRTIIKNVLSGLSALFVEGSSECILIDTRGYEKRSVDKPMTETVVKGSQEGFTEDFQTNVTLVRRIIKNENLMTEVIPLGKTNHSSCAVMYLEGIANPKVIEEVRKRLKKIDTDFILGDGMVEQFIEDNPFMLFPQILSTERPDRTASFIMEGQVVIITEGTPFALAVPVTFFRLFHTSEDSFVRWPLGTFLRLIRMFGLFCATLLPGLYVAVALYHPEMIPTELLSSISKAKETVPFPTILEVLIMEVSFELIREGGIRVPSAIGQTLGIVGALILGQAAVAAGLVSPILIIIVSVTGLGSFAIPNYTMAMAIRIEKFFFIFFAAALGFYGISLLIFLLGIMTCSMKSFGVPFFSPVAPKTRTNPDIIIKYPIWMQRNRPDYLNVPNRRRQGRNVTNWSKEDDGSQEGGDNS
ncbi:spore germination protein A1 [Oxobacter pfennigii]|uniref:Spore germination protein A1 n=1 Tax=Oxobacter pfennigii TaxID=36849 RepID=A0A0N8NTG9_9CLOT|nr:spore germination protein [Oxobacter pfennigii]KPU44800.1 spore germination protein A1 [Oxobacter pfennigii]